MMNAEKALKGALLVAIVCPEEFVGQAVEIAARAANLAPEGTVEKVKAEEAMTDEEIWKFLEELPHA